MAALASCTGRRAVRPGKEGLYRLRDFPPSRWEEVMAAWLAAGREHAVVSHETELELLDLTEVIPDAVHITVPRDRRWYRAPESVIIHTTTRPPEPAEVTIREGVRVTAPVRTTVDVAEAGRAARAVLHALGSCLDREELMHLSTQLPRRFRVVLDQEFP